MKSVLILGAGISGLALGWYLRDQYDVTIAEASNRSGGWIRTYQHEGFLFDCGPHSFRTTGHGAQTLDLIDELGLTSELIAADATDQFLFFNGVVQKIPRGIISLLTSPLTRGILLDLLREWHVPKGVGEESVQAFAERRLGSTVAARFFDPMVSGIFAGDPSSLSLEACFPRFHEMEQEHGSLIKAAICGKKKQTPQIMSFRRGMQCFTDTLAEGLGERLQTGKEAIKVSFGRDVKVDFSDGSSLTADHLYVAIPAWQLAKLLPIPELGHIPFASVAAVSLGYKRKILPHKGFGYLVPEVEKQSILGVVWDSVVFPQQNQHSDETRATVMMGGVRRSELIDLSDQELTSIACKAVSDSQPDASIVMRARQAIPQYELGFSQLRKQIMDVCPHQCTLLGNSFFGVSINDCIKRAREISAL